MSDSYIEKYREQIKKMKDPSLIADLYFCGGLEHPERLNDILKYGFKESGQYSSSHTCIIPKSRSRSQELDQGHK